MRISYFSANPTVPSAPRQLSDNGRPIILLPAAPHFSGGRFITHSLDALQPGKVTGHVLPYSHRWDYPQYQNACRAAAIARTYLARFPNGFEVEFIQDPNVLSIRIPEAGPIPGLSSSSGFYIDGFSPSRPGKTINWGKWYQQTINELAPLARELSDSRPRAQFWIRPQEIIADDYAYYREHPPSEPVGSHTIPVLDRYNTLVKFFEKKRATLKSLGVHLVISTVPPDNYKHLARIETTLYPRRAAGAPPEPITITQARIEPLSVYIRRVMMAAENTAYQKAQ